MPKLIFIVLLKFLLIDYVTSCNAGQYCLSFSNGGTACLDCLPCPAGYSCAGGNAPPVACNVGMRSISPFTTCITCAAGSYCLGATSSQLCPAGRHYQPDTGKAHCLSVPLGNVANTARTDYSTCANGQYRTITGGTCTNLAASEYADRAAKQISRACTPGYYIDLAQSTCTICPAGSSCTGTTTIGSCSGANASPPGASACVPFPSGYSYTSGNVDSIKICSPGKYSFSGACVDCPIGNSCASPLGPPTACVNGQYSDPGKEYCQSCPYGFYCPNPSTKTTVPDGRLIASSGM